MKRVYVSGPYSKGDPAANVGHAMKITNYLLNEGFAPFCPHLVHFLHMTQPRSWEAWMEYDLIWVKQCEILLRLNGESKGADIEVEEAKKLGMPIYFDWIELINKEKYKYDANA